MKVLKPTTIPFPNSGQFIRDSIATYIEDDTLKTAVANEPRWQDGNLFLEKEQINKARRSGEFDNAVWSKTNVSVTPNVATAPDTNTSMDKIIATSVNDRHEIRSNGGAIDSVLSAELHTFSVYVAASELRYFALLYTTGGSVGFDLLTGSVVGVATGGASASITFVGSGIYRCSMTFTPTGAAGAIYICLRNTAGSSVETFLGDNIRGLYLWGAQLEVGSTSSSYIPTTDTAVTRAADICVGNFSRASAARYLDDTDLVKVGENLLVRSQEFDVGSWGKIGTVVTANTTTAPDGTLTADLVSEGSSNTTHYLEQTPFSYVSGTTYTQSVFVKADTTQVVQMLFTSGMFGVNAYANYNIATGTVGFVGTGADAYISDFGNGWYRISLTATATSSGSGVSVAFVHCDNSTSSARAPAYLGTNRQCYAWGAQLEATWYPRGYIPTVSTPVTYEVPSQKYAAIDEPRIQNSKLLLEPYAENLCPLSYNLLSWSLGTCSVLEVSDMWANAYRFFIIAKTTTSNSEYKAEVINPIEVGNELTLTVALLADTSDKCVVGLRSVNSPNWDTGTTVEVLSGPATISSWAPGVPLFENLSSFVPSIVKITRSFQYTPGDVWVIVYPDLPSSTTIGRSVKMTRVQVERGNIATSFIPRVLSQATRAADIHTAGLVYSNAVDLTQAYSPGVEYLTGADVRFNNIKYESLQDANLGNQPDISPTYWLNVGADNISAAFDGKVGSKTTATDKLRMIVYPGTVVDAIGYLETNASIVNTSAIDSEKTVVYYNSTGVTETSIQNWYDYFFVSPLADPATQVVHQGVPSLDPGLFIGVEMIKPGTVELGSFLTGQSTTIGKTQYGLKAGIVDYSKKQADEFGNISIVERPYSKRMSGDVYVSNYDLNKVQRFLYNVRATPVLWMASDNPDLAEVSYVYGFYKDFSTTISYPDVSMCSLEIEGLI